MGRGVKVALALWVLAVAAFVSVVLAVPGHCPNTIFTGSYEPLGTASGNVQLNEVQRWQWTPPGRRCAVTTNPHVRLLTVSGDFGRPGAWEWPVIGLLLVWPVALLLLRPRRRTEPQPA